MKNLRKYFGGFVLLGIIAGFFLPGPALPLKPYLIYLLAIMMFFSCLKISLRELRTVEREWWKYLVLAGIIFFLPACVVFLAKPFLSGLSFAGLMVIAAAPTAIAIVFFADILNGEPSKALIATTLTQLMSVVLTPLIVWFFVHQTVAVDVVTMFVLIGKLVIGPFILAQIFRYFSLHEWILKRAGWMNEVLLFILIWGTIAPASANIMKSGREFAIALGIVSVVLLVQAGAGYWFGGTKKEKITWVIAAISKNFTVASVIVLTLFGPTALVGPAAFVLLSNAVLVPIEYMQLRKK